MRTKLYKKLYLEQQKSLRADLEGKLTAAQEDIKKSQNQLVSLEAQRVQLESKVKSLESQVNGVELGKIVVNPEVKKKTAKEEAIEAKKAAIEAKKAAIAAKKAAKEKPKAPELKPVVEETKAVPAPAGMLEGKILVINKEYNFAVLSFGSRDGINVGDLFSVYHNGNYIGDLRIEKLHDSMSAANFVTPDLKDKIAEGDKVVQKGK